MNIFKYPLAQSMDTELYIPEGSKILNIKCQNNAPYIWILQPSVHIDLERYKFMPVYTGEEVLPKLEDNVKYIDTVLLNEDTLVLHFFLER